MHRRDIGAEKRSERNPVDRGIRWWKNGCTIIFFSYCFSSPSFNPVRRRRVPCEVPKIPTYTFPSNLHVDDNIDAGIAEYFSQARRTQNVESAYQRQTIHSRCHLHVTTLRFGNWTRRPDFSTYVATNSIKRIIQWRCRYRKYTEK